MYHVAFINYESDNRTYKIIEQYTNSALLSHFTSEYEKVFYRKLELSELFNNSITYGESCGIGGVNPDTRVVLENYIRKKQTDKLYHWLSSPNYEKKLYAMEGYKILIMLENYQPNKKEQKLMDNLGIFNSDVQTCGGCSFMTNGFKNELEKIKEGNINLAKYKEPQKEVLEHNNIKIISNDKSQKGLLIIMLIIITGGLLYFWKRRR